MVREIINGSFEPLWRKNARQDADKFKSELLKAAPSRRAFLGGAGAAVLLEYLAQRRAVALPFLHGGAGASSSVTGITNARTGTTYQNMEDACFGMSSGDTLLLPAGKTYQYLGQTYYYSYYKNVNWVSGGSSGYGSCYLGSNSTYGCNLAADYGSIQSSGTANNGRAMLTPPYGILAADFHPADTEMFFDPSTPVTNFHPTFAFISVINSVYDTYSMGMQYSGQSVINNSLTGVSGGLNTTLPAGTLVVANLSNQQGIFVAAGGNPGWSFTNLEFSYTNQGSVCPVFQRSGLPGGPYIGSITMTGCYMHDCQMGPGLGYAGIDAVPVTAQFYDCEIYQCGNGGQQHNMYIGHIGELIFDNCYSHKPIGAWALKSRAALNIIAYSHIRGERTRAFVGDTDQGTDFSQGGLTYLIGSTFELSRHPGNGATVNWNAEGNFYGSQTGGATTATQELYAVNCTLIGPDTGAFRGPFQVYTLGVQPPPFTLLNQSTAGSLAARQYWVAFTASGASGGETVPTKLAGPVGSEVVYETLNVSGSNVLTVATPIQPTGSGGWNCYVNYADPPLYKAASPTADGNNFFWDAGLTQPVFAFTSGGNTISITGTLTAGSNVITAVSGLSGAASLWQLWGMTAYVSGTNQQISVNSVDPDAGTITLVGFVTNSTNYTGTITFGYFLTCGITYQTALGDSVNTSLDFPSWTQTSFPTWYDGSYATNTPQFVTRPFVQVPPGQKLVVNAPPSGPSWATGINVWTTPIRFSADFAFGPNRVNDGWFDTLMGLTKQTSSAVSFGGSPWTSPVTVTAPKSQVLYPNLFLQNSSPISFGTGFTEPTSGLVNNLNPTRTKLQWYRRAGMQDGNGGTADCWYAVVPGGGLSGYSDSIYLTGTSATANGVISIWRGCAAKIFDDNFILPSVNFASKSTSISTAAGNVTVLAAQRSSAGVAGAGFTQISAQFLMNAYYASYVGAQTNRVVTESGTTNASDSMIVDALVGTSAPTLVSSVTITASNTSVINFTISAANAGDVLYLMLGSGGNVAGVGKLSGAPVVSSAAGTSPAIHITNCISANYDNVSYGNGGWTYNGDTGAAIPSASVTVTTSLQANPFNGSTFVAPTWATVFADSVQTDFDYRLAVSSPAKNSASNPGTSPHGQDLIPHYQVNWHGLPTPGTPIPAKAARSDVGPALTGSIGALT
jgi:hypothetical protein